MKNYQIPEISIVSLGEEELIRTSGLSLENEGNLSDMDGLDFGNWN